MDKVRSQAGYTLIEILVVVAIIALLASIVGRAVMSRYRESQIRAAKVQLEGLEQSVKTFQLDTGRIPTTAEGIEALIPPPPTNVRGFSPDGYLEDEEIPVDPWSNPYQYQSDGRRFLLVSLGPDGVPSEDDITNRAPPRTRR